MDAISRNAIARYDFARETAGAQSYALGYSEREFRRLEFQDQFFRDLTEDVLRRAGIGQGMHVLDIGCGVGDVSLLAAELVGPSGSVLGIDRSDEAAKVAARRALNAGHRHSRFIATEIDDFSTDQHFDAIIGQLVLAYLPSPSATLRRLSAHLRPGGIVAFQEMALLLARSVPEGARLSQYRHCCGAPAGVRDTGHRPRSHVRCLRRRQQRQRGYAGHRHNCCNCRAVWRRNSSAGPVKNERCRDGAGPRRATAPARPTGR